uniref:Uncharacterized protein n=1 Tax=Pseudo-nitzschia australis TaxID=44445 RepID=A0A7S4ARS8_9STRA|mmetsp:Transcript_24806/g.54462  ORF Transcript_24806/g.54462 Transcript_24806/m.54462 type:complete len:218 (-) Transcript_24806:91-744(-)|eukprot:CAMPEP_0168178954 /NCGR_PEP_ID=MMETSP0139_2-20121125/9500_1 /TAXON_ID=44445 /ORGANISM="Pseudo-nitzschia australis, Strain 10249 10 AB" /LENGTH=217 /DNA_ID=CAMNT_0008098581 /DNA_START=116 /DNA_END=769 /DNA_ORIENTATION=-
MIATSATSTKEPSLWMEENGERSGSAAGGNEVDDNPSGVTKDQADDEGNANASSNNANANDHNNESAIFSSRPGSACSCKTVCFGLVSLFLLVLFVYSASVQTNDVGGVQWIVFYALNAAVPAAFLVYYRFCVPIAPVYALVAATSAWSVVYIAIAAANVKNTPAGGATDGTGDNDGQTLKEEYIFELAGASLALFSSLYHAGVARFCVDRNHAAYT